MHFNPTVPESDLKLYTNIPCKCWHCENQFFIKKNLARRCFRGRKTVKFCSIECKNKHHNQELHLNCAFCNQAFTRKPSAISKNNFCSSSCAASFNNLQRPEKEKIIPIQVKKEKSTRQCIGCNSDILITSKKYCSNECMITYLKQDNINKWLKNEISSVTGKTCQVRHWVRRYLIECAEYKCSKCGWDKIHPVTGKCPLEINHIDGNPANGVKANLEVLCPNCHALTPNFRALNKNSPRNRTNII